MTRKKIIVVNIDDNDNTNDEVIDTTEPVDKPIEIPQEVIERIETVEESQTPPVEDTPIEQHETQTKTRSQELIKCPKCFKMVTAKTLKYSHKHICSGEEKRIKKESEARCPSGTNPLTKARTCT